MNHTKAKGDDTLRPQLTSDKTCKNKHTYHRSKTASAAAKRRNKAAGFKYLRAYQCNVCEMWHLTTERKIEEED